MLSLFGFGKRRKTTRKSGRKVSRKGSRKGSRKPPARVLKMCKKLKVRVSVKRGSKRVYKPVKVLMKQCKKKLRMLKKARKGRKGSKGRKVRKGRKGRKVVRRLRKARKSMFGRRLRFGACGSMMKGPVGMEFGGYKSKMSGMGPMGMEFGRRRLRFGACGSAAGSMMKGPMGMEFGARRIKFGRNAVGDGMQFGKGRRRPAKKVSKAAAMKAFKAFYRRHCQASSRMGRSRFGFQPTLNMMMGTEFCPLGQGGVLGGTSTGLFPTPCHKYDAKEAAAEESVYLGPRYGGSDKESRVGKLEDKWRSDNALGLPLKGDIDPMHGTRVKFGRRRRRTSKKVRCKPRKVVRRRRKPAKKVVRRRKVARKY